VSEPLGRRFVTFGVTAAAIVLGAGGMLLLFAPDEVGRRVLAPGAWSNALLQLLGAAWLGFAAMNWIARRSALGGIYGRSVVSANQVHFTVGALLLAKEGIATGGSPAFWMLAALYVAGALFFNRLIFSAGHRVE
jgi:hypothetical protein